MMRHYEIANMKIKIENPSEIDLSRFDLFISKSDITDSIVTIKKASKINVDFKVVYHYKNFSVVEFVGEKYGQVFYSGEGKLIAFLMSDLYWKDIDIVYSENIQRGNRSIIDYALGAAFNSIVIVNGGLIVHSSAIQYCNRGLIFSAPSGTGKSTHTKFWRENLGAGIINDDAPVLIPIKDDVLVCGTPWSGSADLFENVSVSLKAIIILSRSHKNEICEMNITDIIQKLIPRCLFPYHNQRLMNTAFENFKKIIGLVPVYHLKCTPSLKAAELVKSYLHL